MEGGAFGDHSRCCMLATVASYARLVALLLVVVCMSAITQTGNWRGPADIACVGEGHSMRPDRRFDELIAWIGDADELAVLPLSPLLARVAIPMHSPSSSERAVQAMPLPHSFHPGAPRGPPLA